jgi:hypothetical protein
VLSPGLVVGVLNRRPCIGWNRRDGGLDLLIQADGDRDLGTGVDGGLYQARP